MQIKLTVEQSEVVQVPDAKKTHVQIISNAKVEFVMPVGFTNMSKHHR